ncbi:MAG: TetR/AcrR family transcriptional regulator [Caulobacteraceae bacterium]|nr:TetR/AcrR family transcriptional regulator [Caulobacteraceae bacterium]
MTSKRSSSAAVLLKRGVKPWHFLNGEERANSKLVKREAVLEAAATEFNERGYHNTSVDDIARRLNVSKPTIYYYVGKKEEILYETQRGLLDSRRLKTLSNISKLKTGAERLHWVINNWSKQICTEVGMAYVRVPDVELSPEVRAEIRKHKREVHGILVGILELGVRDGSLKVSDPKLTAFLLAGAMNSIGVWYEPGRGWTSSRIAKQLSKLVSEGLGA